ncbi:single-stranded DNA-binding protein [Lagierella massiliensis]|uniref:single-stranded DNA-binding protein n=1 Tax=Lagierella massiliensis TaxID=1689303 RepID=UPI0006D84C90|nr:single-stranded DNA-binding protein [Lagierella massiliensis]
MNSVNLIGRLTRDPELRYAAGSGMAICRFTLAVDRGMSKDKKMEAEQKGQPTADFIGITAFGKTAELVSTYMTKGRELAVSGRIQTSSFDGQDGKRVYRTDVIADRIYFIGGSGQRNNQGNSNYSQGNSNYNQGNQNFNQGNNYNKDIGFSQDFPEDDFGLGGDAFPLNDDDIPF